MEATVQRVRTLHGTDVMKQAVIAYAELVGSGVLQGGSWPFDLKAEAVFVRSEEGEIIGIIVWRVYDDAPEEAWLQLSWVEWAWRRKGIYRRMLDVLQDDLRARGVRTIEQAVPSENKAMIGAKTQLGFQPLRTIYALELTSA